jgi:hypothetical protein
MLSIQGVYRKGKIELVEQPTNVREETYVIVTFLERGVVDLHERGMSKEQAAELRAAMSSFADDWDSPEMSIYDNYDAVKSNL